MTQGGRDENDGMLVVVSGLPGSGKSSLALTLARELGVSVLSKDIIKEALFDAIGPTPNLGQVAIDVMFALAKQPGSAVLDSFFWKGKAEADLLNTGKRLVQIYCDCPVDVARRRYESRPRHRAHEDLAPDWETWSEWATPLDLPGSQLTVDTTRPVVIEDVVRFVKESVNS